MSTRTSRTAGMMMTGVQFGNELKTELKALIDGLDELVPLHLINVNGVNDITADTDPVMTAYSGGPFLLKAAQDNTGAMTLKIGSLAALPLKGRGGETLDAGLVKAGDTYLLIHDTAADEFRILTHLAHSKAPITRLYDTPGSHAWTKPDGLSHVVVEVIGGGSGTGVNSSGTYSGGNSGAYARAVISASDLPATVSIVVGAGSDKASGTGVDSSPGGDSSFGSFAVGGGAPASNHNGNENGTPASFSGSHVVVGINGGLTYGYWNNFAPGSRAPVYGVKKLKPVRYADGGDGSYGNGGGYNGSSLGGDADHGVVIVTEYY